MDVGIPKEVGAESTGSAWRRSGSRRSCTTATACSWRRGRASGPATPTPTTRARGPRIVWNRAEAYGRAELVVSIFAPEPRDYGLLLPRQVVLAFWALPLARPDDLPPLVARQITAIGLEVIEDEEGRAPVLTSMSEIAGALAVTVGAGLLLNEFGGKGILMGGAPGVPPANMVILGAGVLGRAAARAATGMGAQVTLLDVSVPRLREAMTALRGPVVTYLATRPHIEKALAFADLVLGAAAVHGQRAPVLVTRPMLHLMKPRSVVMDLAIDMGGCFESSRPTAFPNPTYEVDGILHFCVPNLPSTAARSATQALTSAVLPYLAELADAGLERALLELPDLRRGVYLERGVVAKDSLRHALSASSE